MKTVDLQQHDVPKTPQNKRKIYFIVNKLPAIVQYSAVRTDSDKTTEREKETWPRPQ
jgi:hypothetical protein